MPPRKLPPGITARTAADGTKTYKARWRQGGGRDARSASHTFDRLAEAVDARNRILAAGSVCYCPKHAPAGEPASRAPGLLPADAPAPQAIPFGEYAERHAAALTGVGEGYRRDVVRDVKRHLQGLADKPINAITELDVRELIRGMEAGSHPWLTRPLSPTTIRRQLAQAGSIMAAAMNDGLAVRNPFRGHRLARVVRDEHQGMTFLTPTEFTLLRAELPAGPYRDLASFLIGTGLRFGEATALPVSAVDLLATPPRVHVGRAWQSDGAAGFVLGSPKSARSRRTVPVADWVRDLLVPHVAGKQGDELVFTTPEGAPIRPSNFWHRHWAPAVKRAQANGLDKQPRVHDLRHSHCSWLLAEGRPMHEVSRRLGHQSIALTDARYSHLLPGADTGSAVALERFRPVD